MIMNYAHRGASGYYPENTMLAFEKAIELGCDAIETDVQMTKDGVLVLIHDETVNRTTNGKGFVKDYSYKDLRGLDAGTWFNDCSKYENIPNVEELLQLAKDKGIIINFEIKTGVILYPGIEQKLIDLIYKYEMHNSVILSSFNHHSMVKCKEISKEIKTALLYSSGLYKPELYCKTAFADALHPNYHSINKEVVQGAKEAGVIVNVWTLNTEKEMKAMIAIDVDGIITNYPDKLKTILGG